MFLKILCQFLCEVWFGKKEMKEVQLGSKLVVQVKVNDSLNQVVGSRDGGKQIDLEYILELG